MLNCINVGDNLVSENIFKSKILCMKCGKRYRLKLEGKLKTRNFICGGYHNGNGCTERLVIKESFIRDLLTRRFQKTLNDADIEQILDCILIKDKYDIEIRFLDGSLPILYKGNFVQY